MKIIFVNQPATLSLPPVHSVDIVTHELAKRIARKGCEVIGYGGGEKSASLEYEGVGYRAVVPRLDPVFSRARTIWEAFNRDGIRRPWFASPLHRRGYAAAAAKDAARQNADIIHIHNYSQFVPIFRRFNPKAKIVLHMHCGWLHQLNANMVRRRLARTDLVLGCSEYIVQQCKARIPDAPPLRVLPNGADKEGFGAPSRSREGKRLKMILVARVSPEKGIHIAIQAFVQLARAYPHVDLEIVGPLSVCRFEYSMALARDTLTRSLSCFYPREGPERGASGQANRSYIDGLCAITPPDLSHRITFKGAIPHDEVAQHYRAADIAISPSVWQEPFGMPAVEAMMAGLPVIVSNSGGLPEIVVDGETGLVINRGNVEELSDAMRTLIEDADLRRTMGRNGRAHALERFTWEGAADRLMDYYRGVLDG